MKRFFSSVAFCSFLLIGGAFLIATSSNAKEDVVLTLLNFPAPPPPNPLVAPGPANRSDEFLDRLNPPADEAPIEDLLDYWRHQSRNGYRQNAHNIKPTERVINRILAEIERDPPTVSDFLNIFEGSASGTEGVKRLYDSLSPTDSEGDLSGGIKQWLIRNSQYFADELETLADQSGDANGYVRNDDEFHALTRVDWERARPMVERMYADTSNPASQVLARWALYRNAIESGAMGDKDKYRDELKASVEDRTLPDAIRDLSLDALLIEKEWPGRDDWYYTLMEDATLVEMKTYTGLTTLMMQSSDDKYIDKMIELSASSNPTVKAAAVRNLVLRLNRKNINVVKALLPWLDDPNWAKDTSGSRGALVQALAEIKLPESVPGLISALNEKSTQEVYVGEGNANGMSNQVANAANMASNVWRSNTNSGPGNYRTTLVTYFPLRSSAIGALANQGDMRAAPALRQILPEVERHETYRVVGAILSCGGYTVREQADALEAVANAAIGRGETDFNNSMSMNAVNATANLANYPANFEASDEPLPDEPMLPPNYNTVANTNFSTSSNYMTATTNSMSMAEFDLFDGDLELVLGGQLLQKKDSGDELAREVIVRISSYETRDPRIAKMLRGVLLNWKGPAVNSLLMLDAKKDRSDGKAILKLLSERKVLREKQAADVFDMRTGSPLGIGISACILEDEAGYAGILAGENVEAKASLLACGRLIRARLPVREVAKHLSSTDKRLALAAESYLESEDSPEARAAVLARHPNEAKILGASTAFFSERENPGPNPFLSALFTSVNPALTTAWTEYGMFSTGDFPLRERDLRKEILNDSNLLGIYSYKNNFLRVYADKVVYSHEEDASRYRESTPTKESFEDFKSYLTFNRAEEMAPFLGCLYECEPQQFLMLGKQGGRRVFVSSNRQPEFFTGLEKIFDDMRRSPSKLRYKLEKEVPGLEILFADENLTAETVWKNGADLRVLTSDKLLRKQIDREIEKELAELPVPAEEDAYSAYEQAGWKLRQKREYDNFAWLNIVGDSRTVVAQPEHVEYIPQRDSFAVQPISGRWKAKAGAVEIRANSDGLFKISGTKFTRIRQGEYDGPVVTANGKWAVVAKYGEQQELVRVNLVTNREFTVASGEQSIGKALAFVPATGKILVTSAYYEHYEDQGYGSAELPSGPYFWLDPDTGIVTPAKGEIRPVAQQRFRSLQPAANAFEYWAAIPKAGKNETNVGVYNAKTAEFKTVLKIPNIAFDSMSMWIDGAAGKVYFVYSGHLLALPLNPERK